MATEGMNLMSDDAAKDAAALELAVGSLMAAVDIELDEARRLIESSARIFRGSARPKLADVWSRRWTHRATFSVPRAYLTNPDALHTTPELRDLDHVGVHLTSRPRVGEAADQTNSTRREIAATEESPCHHA